MRQPQPVRGFLQIRKNEAFLSKWNPGKVEMIASPDEENLFQTHLDEIAELVYFESCQLKKLSKSSADLTFENKNACSGHGKIESKEINIS